MYHQTIAVQLTVISSRYQALGFSSIVSIYQRIEGWKWNPIYGIRL